MAEGLSGGGWGKVGFAAATSPAILKQKGLIPVALYALVWAGATCTFEVQTDVDTYVAPVTDAGAAYSITLTDAKVIVLLPTIRQILGQAPSWKIVSASAEAISAGILYAPNAGM